MKLHEFFSNVAGVNLEMNVYTEDRRQMAMDFIQEYPCVKKDHIYTEFLLGFNGMSIVRDTSHILIYGFSFKETELIYPLDFYMADNYLVIGTYGENNKISNLMDGIAYFYNIINENTFIYASFTPGETMINGDYLYLCEGFDSLLKIITTCNYQEQYEICKVNSARLRK